MILCDLPYGTTACKWDVLIPFEPLWKEYWRVLKPNGAVVLFGSEPFSSHLRMSQIKHFKYDWVWCKNQPSNPAIANKQPMRWHELISVFYRKQPSYQPQMIDCAESTKKRWKDGQENINHSMDYTDSGHFTTNKNPTVNYIIRPKTYLNFKVPPRAKGTLHPTQKPVALLEYLIKTYTLEGETVVDNCMGSGSTGVACINTNRKFIGIEKDQKYFEVAQKRIAEASKQRNNE